MSTTTEIRNELESAKTQNKKTKIALIVAGVVIAIVLGVLLMRGLGDATVYFKTASEAVAERDALDGKRFRLEGMVVDKSISEEGEVTKFQLADKGATIDVRNTGQPLGIFQDNIPVVVEGSFQTGSNVFDSDRIMVRHTSDYEAEHPERVSGQQNQ